MVEELVAARMLATSERPYMASALCALSFYPTPGLGTMAVDRYGRVQYDPEFIKSHPVGELAAVLLHEVGHWMRDHFGRAHDMHGVNTRLWNYAGDCAINDDLNSDLQSSSRKMSLPKGCLLPSTFGFESGLLEEEYYQRLLDQAEEASGKGGDGETTDDQNGTPRPAEGWCGTCAGRAHGKELSPEGDSNAIDEGYRELIARDVARAIESHSKAQGNVPAGWKRWAKQVLKPKVDWKRVLRTAVRGAVQVPGKDDYSYKRPCRRQHIYGNIIMPSMHRFLPSVGILIDTSGSMSDTMLSRALAEVKGVLDATNRQPVAVCCCDAAVHSTQTVYDASQITLMGGGGTSMTQGIEHMTRRLKPRVNTLIVITDGYTDWPEAAPRDTNLLVVLTADGGLPPWPCRSVRVEDMD